MLDTPPLGEPTEFGQAMMEAKLEAACQEVGLSEDETRGIIADFRATGADIIAGAFEVVDRIEGRLLDIHAPEDAETLGMTSAQKREQLGAVCSIAILELARRIAGRLPRGTSLAKLTEPSPN